VPILHAGVADDVGALCSQNKQAGARHAEDDKMINTGSSSPAVSMHGMLSTAQSSTTPCERSKATNNQQQHTQAVFMVQALP
jgi:hypothetical protein